MENTNVCQSCGMELTNEDFYGKNSDGSKMGNIVNTVFQMGYFQRMKH